jgi:hypothetical protein
VARSQRLLMTVDISSAEAKEPLYAEKRSHS